MGNSVKAAVLALVILVFFGNMCSAGTEQRYLVLENGDVAVIVDRTASGTVASLVDKRSGKEFAITDAKGGRLCKFIVQDRWPSPAIGEYELADERNDGEGQRIILKREAEGWEFVKEFFVPAKGGYVEVKLSVRNRTGKSEEIVPLIMDRPKQSNYVDGDKTRVWMSAESEPWFSISTYENFWAAPLDGWFALASGPEGRVMWISGEAEKLNLLIPQGSWHTSFTWRSGNNIVSWTYVPVLLEDGDSWETKYRYCVGHGLSKVTCASKSFAVLAARQHFKERVEFIEVDFLGAVSGDFTVLYSIRQDGKAVCSGDIELGLKNGEVVRRKIGLEKGVEGFCVLELIFRGRGRMDEVLEVPLYFGEKAEWKVERKAREVETSGILIRESALQEDGSYYVRKRGTNNFSDTGSCFTKGTVSGWWCNSLVKLHPEDKAGNENDIQRVQELSAVKGEVVSLQLALRNEGGTGRDVKIGSSGFVISDENSVIGAENVRFYEEHYVDCYTVSDVVRGAVGLWPDAIVPIEDSLSLKGNVTTGVWVDIKVPREVSAGVYRGDMIVKVEGKEQKLPIVLKVADVVLPVTSFLRARYQTSRGAEWIALEHRLQPGNIHVGFREHGVYDFNDFDAKFEKMLAKGLNHFDLATFSKRYIEHLKEKGWLKLGSLYTSDEPGERRDLKWRRENYEGPHRIDAGIKVLATVQPYEFAEGTIDIWCPVSNNLNTEMVRRMQERGDEVWWYVCCGPKWPFANHFIDYESVDHLAAFWQTYQLKLDGMLYWSMDSYTRKQDPWKDPINQVKNANGDGYFLYPYEGGIVPSIRIKVLRDGVEDYDLLKMLELEIKRVEEKEPGHWILGEAREALVLDDLTLDDRHYRREPAKYIEHREKVIRVLEKIGKIGTK